MPRPNILVIVTDQQRPDLIGAAGRVPVQTPHLDRLCAEGTRFERAYTPCPLCTPARASMLSGQYPSRHGAWSVGTSTPADVLSLPRLLGANGYRSAIIGKSHLCPGEHGSGSPEAPPRSRDFARFAQWDGPWYGFDFARICVGHVDEPHAYGQHYGAWLQEQGIAPEPPYFSPLELDGRRSYADIGLWELPERYHQSTWAADETIRYLERHVRDADAPPFYLSLNFPDPHPPLRVPAPWHELYAGVAMPEPIRRRDERAGHSTLYRNTVAGSKDALGWHATCGLPSELTVETEQEALSAEETRMWRISCAMTSLLDKHVGRVLEALEEFGLRENTVVLFTSDHGDHQADHWLWGKGGNHFDAAVRVPFILRWPGQVPAGRCSAALQSLVDLPPTLLALAGGTPHPGMQGIDQRAAWCGGESARRGVLVDHRVEQGLYVSSWITERHRLSLHAITAEARNEIELYDLAEDPHEFEECAARHPERVRDLMADMLHYRLERGASWQARDVFA